ncbi:hypothetical protein LBMAG16_12990 [Actinomycetes bacterium]|nr:hypothetical protein LBMAG16_12990 [Actinomycetes bacterium]
MKSNLTRINLLIDRMNTKKQNAKIQIGTARIFLKATGNPPLEISRNCLFNPDKFLPIFLRNSSAHKLLV